MTQPILRTKLYIPPVRPNLVPRARLVERLDLGLRLGHKLTLVSAPAGFGKTTLISAWLAGQARPAAWLSLDEGDEDPARFLGYFIAALQTVDASVGERALAALQSPQPPLPGVMTTLVNDITTVAKPFTLVLDDYHAIDVKAVDDALAFLLDHLPPQMHLAITTREDPNLPLARYRARGQMTELRANDLRFTPDEAAGFLNEAMGLALTPDAIAALEARTEGWIAGLQMAALALQAPLAARGEAQTAAFVDAFTGSHRYVLDYLVEEVLRRQPADVRGFLLETSILERLSGPLCDAVRFGTEEAPIDESSGRDLLLTLERENLFVVPLDERREWYRYHHLFADVLRAHLAEERPARLPVLHRRASDWHERHGLRADAIRHALAAEDFPRAADLLELAWPAMDAAFQGHTWLGWARQLPDELVRARPVLSMAWTWAVLTVGDLDEGERRLYDVERWLGEPAPDGMVVVDQDHFRTLHAATAAARAYIAQARGDVPATITHAQRALELLPADDYLRRGPAASILGLTYWGQGELEAAYDALAEAMDGFRRAGSIPFAISGTYGLADIRVTQGRLRAALETYKRALQLAEEAGEPPIPGTTEIHMGLGLLHHERGEDDLAARHLERAAELGEAAALGDWPYRWLVAQARLKASAGDLDAALALLDEAARRYYPTPVPTVRPIPAQKARIWIRQGRLAEAAAWARETGISPDDALSFLREFEHTTLARLHVALYERNRRTEDIDTALRLLDRLLAAAEAGGRAGSAIELLILQALADRARGDTDSALAPLEHALALAEPEGYAQIFAAEGTPLATLLRQVAGATGSDATAGGALAAYARRLLTAFGETPDEPPTAQPLADPLSERELDVLRLLPTTLSGPEIARELTIAVTTVRTHTRNIYSKLGVGSRRAAVERARALDLLP